MSIPTTRGMGDAFFTAGDKISEGFKWMGRSISWLFSESISGIRSLFTKMITWTESAAPAAKSLANTTISTLTDTWAGPALLILGIVALSVAAFFAGRALCAKATAP